MLTIILLLVMLSIITTIHEFGHFIAGKAFGAYVNEFSIGMGKPIYQHKGKETTFSIRMLPFGGFCGFPNQIGDVIVTTEGETDTSHIPAERCINNLKPIKKIIIYSAGVIMNVVLAFVIISLIYLGVGKASVASESTIVSVQENYPAYEAGLKAGDKITKISYDNGYSMDIDTYSELVDFLSLYDGDGNVHLTILRNGQKRVVNVKPVEEDGRYIFGISFNQYTYVDTNFFNCWKFGFDYIKELIAILVTAVLGLFRGVGYDNMSGIVGIYEVTDQAVSYGFTSYMSLLAIISLNVGIMNLMPLSVFDGGKILTTIIELIIGRPLNKDFEETIYKISLAILLALFVFVTVKDVIQLF